MTEPTDQSFIKQNWYLFAALAVVVVSALYLVFKPDNGQPTESTDAAATAQSREAQYATGPRQTEDEKVLETIREYEQQLVDGADDEMAPALLDAAGNLYKQKLGDYEKAAEKYQVLIIEYPDWVGVRRVYPQLEVAFKELNDDEGRVWLYRRMMENEPPESQEYKYAEQQLQQMGKR